MSCDNCLNLKTGRFNYYELRKRWDEIYSPSMITEGYERRLQRESLKLNMPFEKTRMRFVYCAKGMLSRFYIVRGKGPFKHKAARQNCQYYI